MVISLVRKGPQWSTHLSQESRWQKDQLRSGTRSVGEIALAIGFQSSSDSQPRSLASWGVRQLNFWLKNQEDFSLKKLRRSGISGTGSGTDISSP
jgi:hypothetical protein